MTGGVDFISSDFANHLAADNGVSSVDNTYLGTPENLNDDVEFVKAPSLRTTTRSTLTLCSTLMCSPLATYTRTTPSAVSAPTSRGSSRRSSAPARRAVRRSSTPPAPQSTGAESNPRPRAWLSRRTLPTRPPSSPASATPSTGQPPRYEHGGARFFLVYQSFASNRGTQA